jgi:hypothetical protein
VSADLALAFGRDVVLIDVVSARLSLLAGEKLIAAGRRDEALPFLESALAFYRSVGATFFIRRGEQLFAKSA